jgi:hypothetical protein
MDRTPNKEDKLQVTVIKASFCKERYTNYGQTHRKWFGQGEGGCTATAVVTQKRREQNLQTYLLHTDYEKAYDSSDNSKKYTSPADWPKLQKTYERMQIFALGT